MADQSIHINYSFEDIQRYLQGKMSAAEMHAIEKAALQDPFLADAIEGYNEVDAGIVKQHLNEINAGLFAAETTSKVVALNRKTGWLRIAAMIIVFAGVSILGIYILKTTGDKQQVVQIKKEPGNISSPDSIQVATTPAIKEKEPVLAQNQSKPKTPVNEKKQALRSVAEENKNVQNDAENLTTMMASPPEPEQKKYGSRSFNEAAVSGRNTDSLQQSLEDKISGVAPAPNVFSDKVVNEHNKPVAGVVVESADKKPAAVTNINGDSNLRKNDSLLTVTTSTIDYERAKARPQSAYNDAIVLKQNDGRTQMKAADKTASPVGGWKNFNNYVQQQINKDSLSLRSTGNNEVVEIEFSINNAGTPYNYKILKSLDGQRNAKAIEILKTGPKWNNHSADNKARVSIAF